MKIVKIMHKQAGWQENIKSKVINYLKQFPEFNKALNLFRQYQSGQVTMQDLIQQGLTESDINTAQNLINKFSITTQNNQIETSASYLTWGVILIILAVIGGAILGDITNKYMKAQQSSSETSTTHSPSSTVTQPTRNNLSLRNEFSDFGVQRPSPAERRDIALRGR